MTATAEQIINTLEIRQEIAIAASMDIVFETILEQLGGFFQTPEGAPLSMKLEPWPGGRWFRDFGNNSGHLWAHVQSIKPNTLLELYGPLFMSSPAVSNVLFRLREEAGLTYVQFSHRAAGLIDPQYRDAARVDHGWLHLLTRVRETAERRA